MELPGAAEQTQVQGVGAPLVEAERGGEKVRRWALTRRMDVCLTYLLAAALFVELVVVFLSILSRALLENPWVWTNEAAEMALTTIAFLGGAFAYRRGEHAFIHTLLDALAPRPRRACLVFIQYLVLIVALSMGYSAAVFFLSRWEDLTPVLEIHTSWFVVPLILCMAVLALTAIERLVAQQRLATTGKIASS